jgi:hypothetical protein
LKELPTGKLFANRYLDALAKTMLCFASIHLLFLGVEAAQGNIDLLNVFNILDLDAVAPGLGHGTTNFILSYCVAFAIYGFAYLFLARPNEGRGRL